MTRRRMDDAKTMSKCKCITVASTHGCCDLTCMSVLASWAAPSRCELAPNHNRKPLSSYCALVAPISLRLPARAPAARHSATGASLPHPLGRSPAGMPWGIEVAKADANLRGLCSTGRSPVCKLRPSPRILDRHVTVLFEIRAQYRVSSARKRAGLSQGTAGINFVASRGGRGGRL